MNTTTRINILSRREVEQRTSLSRTSIYRLMDDGKFPKKIRLSHSRVGWLESDIDNWLEQKLAEAGISA